MQLRPSTEERFLSAILFLTPALLLATPKWSIFVVDFLIAYAIYRVAKYGMPDLRTVDKLLIGCFVFYFLTAIPNFLTENYRGRILDIPARHLVAVLLLLALLPMREKLKIGYYYWGAITGAFGALIVAAYEYFVIGHYRIDGFYFSVNFGYVSVALAMTCFCGAFYFSGQRARSVLSIAACVAALAAMIMTGSRGAWIAVPLVALYVLVSLRSRVGHKGIVLGLVTMSLACGLVYSQVELVRDRVDTALAELTTFSTTASDLHLSSTGTRRVLWDVSLRIVEESPLRGLNYVERTRFFDDLVERGEVPEVRLSGNHKRHGHAHSDLLEAGASRGIPGIVATLLIYGVPIIYFYRRRHQDGVVSTTGGAFVFAFMCFGLSEAPLLDNLISIYFLFTLVVFWVVLSDKEHGKSS